jgi:transcriptional regulator with PAS, ATPase and Fis domain
MAEGGSLPLDEIGEMPPYLQTSSCGFRREYWPIGSDRIVHVDFRPICATTSISIPRCARAPPRDLYFRINTITLRVPRCASAPRHPAAVRLLPRQVPPALPEERENVGAVGVSPADSEYIPGNVRELENAIERAVLVAKEVNHRRDLRSRFARSPMTSSSSRIARYEIEKMAILQTLSGRTGTNRRPRRSGGYRPTLYSKMKKHDDRDAGKAAASASPPSAATPAASSMR